MARPVDTFRFFFFSNLFFLPTQNLRRQIKTVGKYIHLKSSNSCVVEGFNFCPSFSGVQSWAKVSGTTRHFRRDST